MKETGKGLESRTRQQSALDNRCPFFFTCLACRVVACRSLPDFDASPQIWKMTWKQVNTPDDQRRDCARTSRGEDEEGTG